MSRRAELWACVRRAVRAGDQAEATRALEALGYQKRETIARLLEKIHKQQTRRTRP